MQKFAKLKFKLAYLARYGLPDIIYPVPAHALKVIAGGGELPLEVLLRRLQQRSRDAWKDWQQFEVAQDRLAQLLSPADKCMVASGAGDNWWLEIGSVDLKLVTIQRCDELVAAIVPLADGRLRAWPVWPTTSCRP